MPNLETHTPFFISGEQVDLRGLTLADAAGPYLSWLNDDQVCEFNSHHVFPYGKEQAEAYIRSVSESRNALVLAVVLKKTGEHIGNISLQQIHAIYRSAEFAILMGDKRYWGKGFAREASALICRHGFEALNLNRIYCGTHADNAGMQRLANALGMKEEGRFRQAQYKNGVYVDTIHYAVLREEFFSKFPESKKRSEVLVPR